VSGSMCWQEGGSPGTIAGISPGVGAPSSQGWHVSAQGLVPLSQVGLRVGDLALGMGREC
jgi:hypothetical protein